MLSYKILLTNGTTGEIITDKELFIGSLVTIDCIDNNGNFKTEKGTIAEILDCEFLG